SGSTTSVSRSSHKATWEARLAAAPGMAGPGASSSSRNRSIMRLTARSRGTARAVSPHEQHLAILGRAPQLVIDEMLETIRRRAGGFHRRTHARRQPLRERRLVVGAV